MLILTATRQITKRMICLLTCDISNNQHTNNFTGYIPSNQGHTCLQAMNKISVTWQRHNQHSHLPEWPMFSNLSEYVIEPSERRQKLYTLKSVSWNFIIFLSFNSCRIVKRMKHPPSVPKFKVDKPSTKSQAEHKINRSAKFTFKSHWKMGKIFNL